MTPRPLPQRRVLLRRLAQLVKWLESNGRDRAAKDVDHAAQLILRLQELESKQRQSQK